MPPALEGRVLTTGLLGKPLNILNCDGIQFIIFSFMDPAFCVVPVQGQKKQRRNPMISSRNFIFLDFTFRCMMILS